MVRPTAAVSHARFAFTLIVSVALLPSLLEAQTRRVPSEPEQATLTDAPRTLWVFFTDKGIDPLARQSALAEVARSYAPRAVQRRLLRRTDPGLFDERDLPIPQAYVDAVLATGARARVNLAWLNAISVSADAEQTRRIALLPFVERLEPVRSGRRLPLPIGDDLSPADLELRGPGYGVSQAQLDQISVTALHALGFTGQGVVIGVLDTGFNRTHQAFNEPGHVLQVLAERDFINNDNDTSQTAADPQDQSRHGTYVLGVIGGYKPGSFLGGAYDASFILCKTEDVSSETPIEEDYYAAALQFIESQGGDIATASLGYIDWYTQAQLDGLTAVTTRAVNIATANGVFCLNAAGNAGHDSDPAISHLIAPADALQVITCGAVDATGATAGFSSDGPSADGRIKPELLAQGVAVRSVAFTNNTGYSSINGTSFSTPLTACAVACLLQARPGWTVDQMRSLLFATASDFVSNGQADPLFVRGYGIVNAAAALAADCNANGRLDAQDVALGHSPDVNHNSRPDECECIGDLTGDLAVNEADLGLLLGAWQSSAAGDLTGDGQTGEADLGVLLANWNRTCAS